MQFCTIQYTVNDHSKEKTLRNRIQATQFKIYINLPPNKNLHDGSLIVKIKHPRNPVLIKMNNIF